MEANRNLRAGTLAFNSTVIVPKDNLHSSASLAFVHNKQFLEIKQTFGLPATAAKHPEHWAKLLERPELVSDPEKDILHREGAREFDTGFAIAHEQVEPRIEQLTQKSDSILLVAPSPQTWRTVYQSALTKTSGSKTRIGIILPGCAPSSTLWSIYAGQVYNGQYISNLNQELTLCDTMQAGYRRCRGSGRQQVIAMGTSGIEVHIVTVPRGSSQMGWAVNSLLHRNGGEYQAAVSVLGISRIDTAWDQILPLLARGKPFLALGFSPVLLRHHLIMSEIMVNSRALTDVLESTTFNRVKDGPTGSCFSLAYFRPGYEQVDNVLGAPQGFFGGAYTDRQGRVTSDEISLGLRLGKWQDDENLPNTFDLFMIRPMLAECDLGLVGFPCSDSSQVGHTGFVISEGTVPDPSDVGAVVDHKRKEMKSAEVFYPTTAFRENREYLECHLVPGNESYMKLLKPLPAANDEEAISAINAGKTATEKQYLSKLSACYSKKQGTTLVNGGFFAFLISLNAYQLEAIDGYNARASLEHLAETVAGGVELIEDSAWSRVRGKIVRARRNFMLPFMKLFACLPSLDMMLSFARFKESGLRDDRSGIHSRYSSYDSLEKTIFGPMKDFNLGTSADGTIGGGGAGAGPAPLFVLPTAPPTPEHDTLELRAAGTTIDLMTAQALGLQVASSSTSDGVGMGEMLTNMPVARLATSSVLPVAPTSGMIDTGVSGDTQTTLTGEGARKFVTTNLAAIPRAELDKISGTNRGGNAAIAAVDTLRKEGKTRRKVDKSLKDLGLVWLGEGFSSMPHSAKLFVNRASIAMHSAKRETDLHKIKCSEDDVVSVAKELHESFGFLAYKILDYIELAIRGGSEEEQTPCMPVCNCASWPTAINTGIREQKDAIRQRATTKKIASKLKRLFRKVDRNVGSDEDPSDDDTGMKKGLIALKAACQAHAITFRKEALSSSYLSEGPTSHKEKSSRLQAFCERVTRFPDYNKDFDTFSDSWRDLLANTYAMLLDLIPICEDMDQLHTVLVSIQKLTVDESGVLGIGYHTPEKARTQLQCLTKALENNQYVTDVVASFKERRIASASLLHKYDTGGKMIGEHLFESLPPNKLDADKKKAWRESIPKGTAKKTAPLEGEDQVSILTDVHFKWLNQLIACTSAKFKVAGEKDPILIRTMRSSSPQKYEAVLDGAPEWLVSHSQSMECSIEVRRIHNLYSGLGDNDGEFVDLALYLKSSVQNNSRPYLLINHTAEGMTHSFRGRWSSVNDGKQQKASDDSGFMVYRIFDRKSKESDVITEKVEYTYHISASYCAGNLVSSTSIVNEGGRELLGAMGETINISHATRLRESGIFNKKEPILTGAKAKEAIIGSDLKQHPTKYAKLAVDRDDPYNGACPMYELDAVASAIASAQELDDVFKTTKLSREFVHTHQAPYMALFPTKVAADEYRRVIQPLDRGVCAVSYEELKEFAKDKILHKKGFTPQKILRYMLAPSLVENGRLGSDVSVDGAIAAYYGESTSVGPACTLMNRDTSGRMLEPADLMPSEADSIYDLFVRQLTKIAIRYCAHSGDTKGILARFEGPGNLEADIVALLESVFGIIVPNNDDPSTGKYHSDMATEVYDKKQGPFVHHDLWDQWLVDKVDMFVDIVKTGGINTNKSLATFVKQYAQGFSLINTQSPVYNNPRAMFGTAITKLVEEEIENFLKAKELSEFRDAKAYCTPMQFMTSSEFLPDKTILPVGENPHTRQVTLAIHNGSPSDMAQRFTEDEIKDILQSLTSYDSTCNTTPATIHLPYSLLSAQTTFAGDIKVNTLHSLSHEEYVTIHPDPFAPLIDSKRVFFSGVVSDWSAVAHCPLESSALAGPAKPVFDMLKRCEDEDATNMLSARLLKLAAALPSDSVAASSAGIAANTASEAAEVTQQAARAATSYNDLRSRESLLNRKKTKWSKTRRTPRTKEEFIADILAQAGDPDTFATDETKGISEPGISEYTLDAHDVEYFENQANSWLLKAVEGIMRSKGRRRISKGSIKWENLDTFTARGGSIQIALAWKEVHDLAQKLVSEGGENCKVRFRLIKFGGRGGTGKSTVIIDNVTWTEGVPGDDRLGAAKYQDHFVFVAPTKALAQGHRASIRNVGNAHKRMCGNRGNTHKVDFVETGDKGLALICEHGFEVLAEDEAHKAGMQNVIARVLADMCKHNRGSLTRAQPYRPKYVFWIGDELQIKNIAFEFRLDEAIEDEEIREVISPDTNIEDYLYDQSKMSTEQATNIQKQMLSNKEEFERRGLNPKVFENAKRYNFKKIRRYSEKFYKMFLDKIDLSSPSFQSADVAGSKVFVLVDDIDWRSLPIAFRDILTHFTFQCDTRKQLNAVYSMPKKDRPFTHFGTSDVLQGTGHELLFYWIAHNIALEQQVYTDETCMGKRTVKSHFYTGCTRWKQGPDSIFILYWQGAPERKDLAKAWLNSVSCFEHWDKHIVNAVELIEKLGSVPRMLAGSKFVDLRSEGIKERFGWAEDQLKAWAADATKILVGNYKRAADGTDLKTLLANLLLSYNGYSSYTMLMDATRHLLQHAALHSIVSNIEMEMGSFMGGPLYDRLQTRYTESITRVIPSPLQTALMLAALTEVNIRIGGRTPYEIVSVWTPGVPVPLRGIGIYEAGGRPIEMDRLNEPKPHQDLDEAWYDIDAFAAANALPSLFQ
jgi:hypothetical protein